MFYSKTLQLLFIACPKTGSRSVENLLLKLDPEGQRFTLESSGKTYTSADVPSGNLGHATAGQLRKLLGRQVFGNLRTFGFVRDPREKLVSTYFFKRKESIRHSLFRTWGPKRFTVTVRSIAGILLARLLPFPLWVRIWPMKRCSHYFLDEQGRVIVEFLGRTERLGQDLVEILRRVGVTEIDEATVPHLNQSSHRDPREYFTSDSLNGYIDRKYADDIRLARLVEGGVFVGTSTASQL